MSYNYKPYLPFDDSGLMEYGQNFITIANANIAETPFAAPQLVELNDLLTDYSVTVGDKTAAYAVARAATTARNQARLAFRDRLRQLAQLVRNAPETPDTLKELLWLTPPDMPPAPIEPQIPEGLVAKGFGAGYNLLTWERSGNRAGTVYIIQMRTREPLGEWVYVDTASKTRYKHLGQTPGVPLDYRIYALRAGERSMDSETATVYGSYVEPTTLTLEEAA